MIEGILVDDAGWRGAVPDFNLRWWERIGAPAVHAAKSARPDGTFGPKKRGVPADRARHIVELLKRRNADAVH